MIEQILIPRSHDLGNFNVFRALPNTKRRMVGPFIFWDQMGPGEFLTGHGLDVRPHPHIGLATLTYLFDGQILHRDNLGSEQVIHPGDVNIMVAGSGVVHSERTPQEIRHHPHQLFGIQSWLALPLSHEETQATFTHIPQSQLPMITEKGMNTRLIAGSYMGLKSPLQFPHDTMYMDIQLKAGEQFSLPLEAEERAIYPLKGRITISGVTYAPMQLLVVHPKDHTTLVAESDCHFLVLGGAVMDGPRYIWWNFVSSSKERIEEAKEQWQEDRFPKISGEVDFIPLPN